MKKFVWFGVVVFLLIIQTSTIANVYAGTKNNGYQNFATVSDVYLSSSTIKELNSYKELIGTLSTNDLSNASSYTYELVGGTGATDNRSFVVEGDKLLAKEVFEKNRKSSYSIRVKASGNGGTFEKALTITINARPTQPGYTGYSDAHPRINIIDNGNKAEPRFVGVYYPERYYTNPELKWGVIIHFGGNGEFVGNDPTKSYKTYATGPLREAYYNGKEFNYIILSPVANYSFSEDTRTSIYAWIRDFVNNESRIDRSRIFTTGLSNGAPEVMMRMQTDGKIQLAGMVPIAPYDNSTLPAWSLINKVAVWGFTKELDNGNTVNAQYNLLMSEPGRTADTKMTIFAGKGHNAWNYVFPGNGTTLEASRTPNSPYPDKDSYPPFGDIYNYFDQFTRTDVNNVPNEPVALKASISSGSIKLAWANYNSGSNSIIIEKRIGSQETVTLINDAGTGAIFYDNDVTKGVKYSYRVRYKNSYGTSNWSNLASILFDVVVDMAPTDISISNASIDEGITGKVATISDNGNPSCSYTVSGNNKFTVKNNNELWATTPCDYSVATSESVTIAASNSKGQYQEKFTIKVNEVIQDPAASSIVQIHVARLNDNPTQVATKGNYFNLLQVDNSNTEYYTADLMAKDGITKTSIKVSTTKSTTSGFSYSMYTNTGAVTGNNSGVVPDAVLKYFACAYNDLIGEIIISGLDPNKVYDIKTLSNGRDEWNGMNLEVNVKVQGQLKSQNFSPTGGNTSGFLIWNSVAPLSDGTIKISAQGKNQSYAPINAIIVGPANTNNQIFTVSLSNAKIKENITGLVGKLSVSTTAATSYSIVSNSKFQIKNGNELWVVSTLDYSVNPVEKVTVRATNSGGSVDQEFSIQVIEDTGVVADSEVFQIHLAHEDDSPVTETSKGSYFNLLTVNNSNTDYVVSNLMAKDGITKSSISVTCTKSSSEGFSYKNGTNSGVTTGNNTGVVPDKVLQYFASSSYDLVGNITISGLDPSKDYAIRTLSNGRSIWNGNDLEVNVTVQGSTQSQNFAPTGGNQTEFLTWNNIRPDTKGNVTIKVQGKNQTYGPINAVIIAPRVLSGLRLAYEDRVEEELADVKLFPMPASSEINIMAENIGDSDVTMYDLAGNKINFKTLAKNDKLQVIDTSVIPSGIYVVKIHSKENSYLKRISIVR